MLLIQRGMIVSTETFNKKVDYPHPIITSYPSNNQTITGPSSENRI